MVLSSSDAPACAICGLPLGDGATIPTTSGGQVHLRCAERQSRAAARGRAIRAVSTAAILTGLLMLVAGLGVGDWGLVGLLGLFVLSHMRINHRWWHYTARSIRWWLRIRG